MTAADQSLTDFDGLDLMKELGEKCAAYQDMDAQSKCVGDEQ